MKRVSVVLLAVLASIAWSHAAIINGTCGENLTWTLNTKDSTLTIEGSGELTSTPWKEYARYIATAIFPENLTKNTAYYIFGGCDNLHTIVWNVKTFSNASMLHSNDRHPFYGRFSQIKSITFGVNVEYLPQQLCKGMTNLQSITCHSLIPPSTGSDVFTDVPRSSIKLFVPQESMDSYANALWWEEFINRPIGSISLVTFVDWDGSVLSSDYVDHGTAATAPKPKGKEGYTFIGWDKDFSNIKEDMTITALYETNRYKVDFVDWNGEVLKTDSVPHGYSGCNPINPTREGYTFTGWDNDYSIVTGDMKITAQYTINYYPVYFSDWNGTILSQQNIAFEQSAKAPANPTRSDYNFAGWSGDYSRIVEPLVLVAQYEKLSEGYTIIYKDELGNVLDRENIILHIPETPVRESKEFIGWQTEPTSIEEGIVIRATFTGDDQLDFASPRTNQQAQKILKDEQVLILRGEKIYTIPGQEIK